MSTSRFAAFRGRSFFTLTNLVVAALTVMAISGRLVATASTTMPPIALPRCSFASMTSVVFDSWMPAIQITAAPATKISASMPRGSESIWSSKRPRHPLT